MFLFKDLLGQGGEHSFIRKLLKHHHLYLDLKYYLHFSRLNSERDLMVKRNCGFNKIKYLLAL